MDPVAREPATEFLLRIARERIRPAAHPLQPHGAGPVRVVEVEAAAQALARVDDDGVPRRIRGAALRVERVREGVAEVEFLGCGGRVEEAFDGREGGGVVAAWGGGFDGDEDCEGRGGRC